MNGGFLLPKITTPVILTGMKPLSLSRPHLIILVGIPGAGKSYFGERFGNTFKAPVINQGKLQKELFGELRDDVHEAELADQVARTMLSELVKTGATIVYDGPTDSRVKRQELIRFAHSVDYSPVMVWVQTDSSEAARRATNRRKADGFLTEAQFDSAVRHFTIPNQNEHAVVISGKHTYTTQLKNVLKHLTSTREAEPVAPPTPRPNASGDIRPVRRRPIIR